MPKRPTFKTNREPSGNAAAVHTQTPQNSTKDNGAFISGPARVRLCMARIDITEIVSERFDPKRCIDNRGDRLVCVAYDRFENREVALKVQRKPSPSGTGPLTEVEREALIGQLLPDHVNVLTLSPDIYYLPGIDGQRLAVLAMEYAEGGSLRQWFQQQTSWDAKAKATVLHHFRSVCLGVSALHERGIKHLDLKPENILLCAGVAKISDFGASSVGGLTQGGKGATLIPKVPCSSGTPSYMSPEQFTARNVDELTEAADIYPLGVMFFEMLNPLHRPPFIGSYQKLRQLHQTAAVPDSPNLRPEELEIVRGCMAKDPHDRFDSVEQLLEALDAVFPVGFEVEPTQAEIGISSSKPNTAKEDDLETRKEAGVALYAALLGDLEHGDLDELLELAAKAAEVCPEHPQAEVVYTRLAHRVKAFSENLAACNSEWKANRTNSALLFAQQAAAAHPKSVVAMQVVAHVSQHIDRVGRLRAEMDRAVSACDFERATRMARQLDELGVDAEPKPLIEGAI